MENTTQRLNEVRIFSEDGTLLLPIYLVTDDDTHHVVGSNEYMSLIAESYGVHEEFEVEWSSCAWDKVIQDCVKDVSRRPYESKRWEFEQLTAEKLAILKEKSIS